MGNRHYFYLNDGRVFATDGLNMLDFILDEQFDGLRASYVSPNRRPKRRPKYPPPSRLKKLRLRVTDLLMRAYRWLRRQIRLANNKPIYFHYERTSNNL